jgi:gamma-glutamyltranspeptidase/glutathione hydrolase
MNRTPRSHWLTAMPLAITLLVANACMDTKADAPPRSAPLTSAPTAGTLQSGHHAIVVAANPLAAKAGLDILRSGGSAADAAVAMQAVLGLVEPQSSGLGGGAFITYYDAHSRQVIAYNGRETAPAGATPALFLDDAGKPLPFVTAVLSGRSTGVPGAIAAVHLLQHEHGKLRWNRLFGEAQSLAINGFTVSPRLQYMINSQAPQASAPDAVRYFSKPDGSRYAAGDVLRNPAYAASLQAIADHGANGLLTGPIARDIVARTHAGDLPGTLSLEDLAHYQPVETHALCHDWERYQVCTPPPPGGGVGVLEALLLLSHTDIATRGPNDPLAWVEMGEAQRLMYADRNLYIGDPAFVPVPVQGLLDADYLRDRAQLIGARIAADPPAAGHPPGQSIMGPDHTVEPGGTTNLVIVDTDGNVVCMTTTVESIFGSGRMVDGFFLNNQLTDFSFTPRTPDGQPAANAVAAGKHPRSAMSPLIVLDSQGRFVGAAGSAGGPAIIAYVLKTLIATFDWHLSMQDAVSLPNVVAHGANFSGEADKFQPAMVEQLNTLGINLHPGQYEESGLTGVRVDADGLLTGGADPRREGVALAY